MTEELIKAEFHCHTVYSPDSLTRITKLIRHARNLGLDKLAITDHSTIAGAQEAFALAPDLIVPGVETRSAQGEVLGYFVTENIPKRLTALETVKRMKDQGAVICLPHPFDYPRSNWDPRVLEEILPYLDGIEVFNARSRDQKTNLKALEFARKHDLLELAGSDAHTLMELGKAHMTLPDFSNAEELKVALKTANRSCHPSSPAAHIFSRLAKISKDLSPKPDV